MATVGEHFAVARVIQRPPPSGGLCLASCVADLAEILVADLRLLMVETVSVSNKRYVDENHTRR